jgi:PIN domain nuclease of toxin-antitoxin system
MRPIAPFLSPTSVWELSMLTERKRVALIWILWSGAKRRFRTFLRKRPHLRGMWRRNFLFTRFVHRDPGDRILVATAKVFDLTLVTADQWRIEAPGLKILANR